MSPVYHFGSGDPRKGNQLRLVTFRVPCFVWIDRGSQDPLRGMGFVGDLSEKGIGLYSDTKISKASMVRVALENPEASAHLGIVLWCRRYNFDQRFHGQGNLNFHVGIELHFSDPAEQQRYFIELNELRKRAASLTGEFKF